MMWWTSNGVTVSSNNADRRENLPTTLKPMDTEKVANRLTENIQVISSVLALDVLTEE